MIRLALAALTLASAAPASAHTYVVRHLDTPTGELDPDLLPHGQAGASRLIEWFRGKRLTAIYISDFKRTRQTATPLANARELVLTVYDSPTRRPCLPVCGQSVARC